MSEPGDVVWADGQAWIRGTTAYGDHKAWWCHPLPVSGEVYRRLSEAEQADDFMWLVKDGIPIVLNALAVYQALDSFADFVAKRDADAELTAERDALLSRLAEMTAQRDRAVAKGSELAADLVESERQHDEARDELKCGDRHSYGFKCGQQEERRAVVAWLNKDPQGWARQWSLAGRIERGEHDV